ncbi:MAG: hypothetical protein ABR547_08385 [Halanaerobium sp.]
MLANSLIVGLITYNAVVVYNLLGQRSLEAVFWLGLSFLFYSTLMTLFLQLSFYLLKDYTAQTDSTNNNQAGNSSVKENGSAAETEAEIEDLEPEEQEFEKSTVENEFDNEGFSALNQEGFDYQQNTNQ